ncbi:MULTISPECIES: hypothetical protein [Rhodococcus]|nr:MULTISPECIES: hypothetical protein [Rhodococcus]MBP1158212.1 hypothetical protein [Rhodococcus sp. PvR099]MCZ4554187.1 hypothetical protein [Rhodococcus maanshanensis]
MTNGMSVSGRTTRPGPPHLVGLTEPADRPCNVSENFWAELLEVGWAARLRSQGGQTRFQLRYYGERSEGLIVGDDLPALVYAVTESGQQILLFDGAAHGHDAMFCDSWDEARLRTRCANQVYVDAEGENTFELVVWVGYNIDWGDERHSITDADDPDLVTLVDGRRIPFEVARHAAFDAVLISATNVRGQATDAVSEELA